MSYTFVDTIDAYASNLAGTLAVTILDKNGSVLIARATSPITHIAQNSYAVEVPGIDPTWTAFAFYDDGAGFSASDPVQPQPSPQLGGANNVTVNFIDADSNPVPQVIFSVFSTGARVGSSQAANGSITFGLPDGDYTLVANPTANMLFTSHDFTVSGTTTVNMTGSGITPPSAAPAGKVNASAYYQDLGIEPNAKVEYRLTKEPDVAGVYSGRTQCAPIDPNTGLILVQVYQNAEYEWWFGRGERKSMIVGTVDLAIPKLVSAQTPNSTS